MKKASAFIVAISVIFVVSAVWAANTQHKISGIPGGIRATLAGNDKFPVETSAGTTYYGLLSGLTTLMTSTGVFQPTITRGYEYFDAGKFVPGTCSGLLQTAAFIDYLAFDGATEEYAYLKWSPPDDWDAGTIKMKVFWSSATGSASGDTLEWEISGVAIANDDVLSTAYGTAQVVSDTLLANNGGDLQVSGATPAITIGNTPAAGEEVLLRFSRNVGGTDDMTEDAWLLGIKIEYGRTGTNPAAW